MPVCYDFSYLGDTPPPFLYYRLFFPDNQVGTRRVSSMFAGSNDSTHLVKHSFSYAIKGLYSKTDNAVLLHCLPFSSLFCKRNDQRQSATQLSQVFQLFLHHSQCSLNTKFLCVFIKCICVINPHNLKENVQLH